MRPRDARRLLRWYPPRWRERYGDELLALVEQQLGDARPSLRLRLSLARAGTAQRLHDAGLVGSGADGPQRIRAGSLTVLWAWVLFALAGLGLAKASEHWQAGTPSGSRLLPSVALDATQAVAGLTALLLAAAALAAAPALRELLRDGGWRPLRRPVLRALALSALTACALAALVVWAHRLPASRRDGSDVAYALAAAAVALLTCTAACAWAAAATRVLRLLELRPPVLRLHARVACAVAAALALMTITAALWWASVASAGAPWDPSLVVVLGAMPVAVALAGLGARRVLSARPWAT